MPRHLMISLLLSSALLFGACDTNEVDLSKDTGPDAAPAADADVGPTCEAPKHACGKYCCEAEELCSENDTCVPKPCTPETAQEICARVGRCGKFQEVDSFCDQLVQVDCGCPDGKICNPATQRCQLCPAETKEEFCGRMKKSCGEVEGTNDCGDALSYDCGSCETGTECGEEGACVECAFVSDEVICANNGKNCGHITLPYTCGRARLVDCGACGAGSVCGDNVCGSPHAPVNDGCEGAYPLQFGDDGISEIDVNLSLARDSGPRHCLVESRDWDGVRYFWYKTEFHGNDMVFRLDVEAGTYLEIEAEPSAYAVAPSLYITKDCEDELTTLDCAYYNTSGPMVSKPIDPTMMRHFDEGGSYYLWVKVDRMAVIDNLTLKLRRTVVPRPANDTCEYAKELTIPQNGLIIESSTLGTFNTDVYGCPENIGDRDSSGGRLFYKFHVSTPSALQYTMSTVTEENYFSKKLYFPLVSVHKASCGSPDALSCARYRTQARVLLDPNLEAIPYLEEGDYLIVVGGQDHGRGAFSLELQLRDAVSNTTCQAAEAVGFADVQGVPTATITGNTRYGRNRPEVSCRTGMCGRQLNYAITVPAGARKYLNIAGDFGLLGVEMWADCPGTEQLLSFIQSPMEVRSGPLAPGRTYYLDINGAGVDELAFLGFVFDLTLRDVPAAPVNDKCENAMDLGVMRPNEPSSHIELDIGTLEGATRDLKGTSEKALASPGVDVVYKFKVENTVAFRARVTSREDSLAGPTLVLVQSDDCAPNVELATGYYAATRLPFNARGDTLFLPRNPLSSMPGAALMPGTYYLYVVATTPVEGAFYLDLSVYETEDEVINGKPTSVVKGRSCAKAVQIPIDAATGIGTMRADTAGAFGVDKARSLDCMYMSAGSTPDLFFKFTVPAGGQRDAEIVVAPDRYSGQAPIIYLRTDCANPLTEFSCETVSSTYAPAKITPKRLAGGATYFLVVDSVLHALTDSYAIEIKLTASAAAPANDKCSAALVDMEFVENIATAQGDTAEATDDYQGSCYSRAVSGNDLVYQFQLTEKKYDIKVSVTSTADFAPAACVRSTCDATAAGELACSRDMAEPILVNNLAPGKYYVVVDSDLRQSSGPFTLTVERIDAIPPPANDVCGAGVTGLTFDGSNIAFISGESTIRANNDTAPRCTPYPTVAASPDVFYSFTTPAATVDAPSWKAVARVFRTGSYRPASPYIAEVAIRSVCDSNAAEHQLGCGYDLGFNISTKPAGVGVAMAVAPKLLPSTTYYVVVDGSINTSGTFDLEVRLFDGADTPDNCASAETLDFLTGVESIRASTFGAVNDSASSTLAAAASAGADVVYHVKPLAPSDLTVNLTFASTFAGATLYIRKGVCASTNKTDEIASAVRGGGGPVSLVVPDLVAGTDYYIWVDGEAAMMGEYWLDAELIPTTTVPTNVSCTTATPVPINNDVGSISGSTLRGANTNTASGMCGVMNGNDQVFSFEISGTENRSVKIELAPALSSPTFVPSLYLRSGCGGATEKALGCVLGVADTTTRLSRYDLRPGIYYIYVDSPTAGMGGGFELTVTLGKPIAYPDTCDEAVSIALDEAGRATVVGDTTAATNDSYGSVAGCGMMSGIVPYGGPGRSGRDLVYKLDTTTLSGNRDLTASLFGSTERAMQLYLKRSCDGHEAGDELGCVTESAFKSPTLRVDNLAAGVYYLWVDDATTSDTTILGAGSVFSLAITLEPTITPSESPSLCHPAKPIHMPAGGFVEELGTTVGGFAGDPGAGTYNGPSVYYALTLAESGRVTIKVERGADAPTTYTPSIMLRDGGCSLSLGSASPTVNANSNFFGAQLTTATALSKDSSYILTVDSQAGTNAAGSFKLTIIPYLDGKAVVEGQCAPTAQLTVGLAAPRAVFSSTSTTSSALFTSTCLIEHEPPMPDSILSGTAKEVLFGLRVAAGVPQGKRLTIDVMPLDTNFKPLLELRSGPCDITRQQGATVGCGWLYSTGSATATPRRIVVDNVTPGDYNLWVDATGEATGGAAVYGPFILDIKLEEKPAANPPGDTCAQAAPITLLGGASAHIEGTFDGATNSTELSCINDMEPFFINGPDRYYLLDLAVARKVTARLSTSPTLWAGMELRPDCSSDHKSMACAATTSLGRMVTLSSFSIPRVEAGKYRLVVLANEGRRYGNYEIDLVLDEPGPGIDNDTCETATPIILDAHNRLSFKTAPIGNATSGEELPSFDLDGSGYQIPAALVGPDIYYSLQAPAGKKLSVSVRTHESLATAIFLRADCEHAGNGQEIHRVDSAKMNRQGTDPSAKIYDSTAIMVHNSLPPSPTGTYILAIDTRNSGPHELQIDVSLEDSRPITNDSCPVGTETGEVLQFVDGRAMIMGNIEDGTPDTVGRCHADSQGETFGRGSVGPDRVYVVKTTEAHNLDATVMSFGGFVPSLYLRKECASEDVANELACTYMESVAAIKRTALPAGTYYLWVDSSVISATGAYVLDVKLEPTTGALPGESCDNPIELENGVPWLGSNAAYQNDYGNPLFAGSVCNPPGYDPIRGKRRSPGADIIFKYTHLSDAPFGVTVDCIDGVDTTIMVSEGVCDGSPQSCGWFSSARPDQKNNCMENVQLSYPKKDQTYYIIVDSPTQTQLKKGGRISVVVY